MEGFILKGVSMKQIIEKTLGLILSTTLMIMMLTILKFIG